MKPPPIPRPPIIHQPPPQPQIIYVTAPPPQRKLSSLRWILGCVLCIAALPALMMVLAALRGFPQPTQHKDAGEPRKAVAKTGLERLVDDGIVSLWSREHYGLARAIKQSMNDPKSYEHVKTVYYEGWNKNPLQGETLIVRTTFRGRNAFGGLVLNWVKAEVDLKGNVTILEQGVGP